MSEPNNGGNNKDAEITNTENYKNNDKNNKNLVKVYLYNKVNVNGQDDSKYISEEIQSIIDKISKSKDPMCERRRDVGVGFLFGGNVYGEMKLIGLLNDVFESQILGKYYASIAVASMAAERLCYDYVENLEIKFGERILSIEEKEQLLFIPYGRLSKFLKNIGNFNNDDLKLLDEINRIRNRHILFSNNKFLIPQTNYEALKNEDELAKQLIENLRPHEKDVIVIGTDDSSKKRAEFGAKNAALVTVLSHEKHQLNVRFKNFDCGIPKCITDNQKLDE